eukprot:2051734-Amphidinium_carterae.1
MTILNIHQEHLQGLVISWRLDSTSIFPYVQWIVTSSETPIDCSATPVEPHTPFCKHSWGIISTVNFKPGVCMHEYFIDVLAKRRDAKRTHSIEVACTADNIGRFMAHFHVLCLGW